MGLLSRMRDPLDMFEDKRLIEYILKRITESKGTTYSDVRLLVEAKYKKMNEEALREERDSFNSRKIMLENANIESISMTIMNLLFIFATILIGMLTVFLKDPVSIGVDFRSYLIFLAIAYIVTITLLSFIYSYSTEKTIRVKAREIAYCALVLEVIEKEMKKFNIIAPSTSSN